MAVKEVEEGFNLINEAYKCCVMITGTQAEELAPRLQPLRQV